MSLIMTIIESAETCCEEFEAIFLSTGTRPFLRAPGRGAALPIDAIRMITNADVLAAYSEFQSESNVKVLTASSKTERRGAMAVSVGGKGRYRIDWYQQRSSLSMTIRRVPFDKGPWTRYWATEDVRETFRSHIAELLAPGKVMWVTAEAAHMAHAFCDAIAEECVNAHRWAKIVKIDDPVRYLHKSADDCLVEQIEVGVDCESVNAAVRVVAVSAMADGAVIDVPWNNPDDVQAAIDNLRAEGMWVVACAPMRYASTIDSRIVVDPNRIEVLA